MIDFDAPPVGHTGPRFGAALAQTAWDQIPRYTKMLLGAKNPVTSSDGALRFSTTNHGGRRVIVRLNSWDLYDIEVGRIRNLDWKADVTLDMVDAAQLGEVLERIFGERS